MKKFKVYAGKKWFVGIFTAENKNEAVKKAKSHNKYPFMKLSAKSL